MERKKAIGYVAASLFALLGGAAVAENSRIKLTDGQLDAISAGTVELTITANTFAAGSDGVVALAYTNSDIRSNRRGRTIARGSALSTAIGEIVSTETGYILNTDENIISLRAMQRIRNSESGTLVIKTRILRNGRVTVTTIFRPARNGNRNRNGRPIVETNTLRVRAVTRR